jgi:serralysin
MPKHFTIILISTISLAVLLVAVLVLPQRGLAVAEQGNFLVYLPLVIGNRSQPLPVPTQQPPPEQSFAEQVVTLTNQQRIANGCDEVTMDERLRLAAQGHSQDMALNDYFSHTGLDGSSPGDRINAKGYWYSWAGENIAAGYDRPESVVSGWMNSQGHRDNILNCNFVHIGVGYYYLKNDTGNENWNHYWTQVFASP